MAEALSSTPAALPNAADKKEATRVLVAQEMVATEQSFVDALSTCEEMYYKPTKTMVPMKVHKALFSNLLTLRDLNARFLQDMQERVAKWDKDSTLGDLFLKFAPFFKMYTQYVNNYERIGPLLTQLKHNKKYATFQKFEDKQRQDPRCKGNRMAQYLIMPIQRVTRYKLILEKLLKNTPPDHKDCDLLSQALAKIESVANHINECVRTSENRKIIMEIQEKFDNTVTFIAPHRLFMMAGTLAKLDLSAEDKLYRFFLFNDVLVWAKPRNKGGKYKLENSVPIDEKFEIEVVDRKVIANCLKIIYDQQSFFVVAASPDDANLWYEAFQKAVRARASTISGKAKLRRRASFVMAPTLRPKTDSNNCDICTQAFGIFRKRYNCKRCGEVVCADCSKSRVPVIALGKKVRVCNPCAVEIAEDEKKKRAEEASGVVSPQPSPSKTPVVESKMSAFTRIGDKPFVPLDPNVTRAVIEKEQSVLETDDAPPPLPFFKGDEKQRRRLRDLEAIISKTSEADTSGMASPSPAAPNMYTVTKVGDMTAIRPARATSGADSAKVTGRKTPALVAQNSVASTASSAEPSVSGSEFVEEESSRSRSPSIILQGHQLDRLLVRMALAVRGEAEDLEDESDEEDVTFAGASQHNLANAAADIRELLEAEND